MFILIISRMSLEIGQVGQKLSQMVKSLKSILNSVEATISVQYS